MIRTVNDWLVMDNTDSGASEGLEHVLILRSMISSSNGSSAFRGDNSVGHTFHALENVFSLEGTVAHTLFWALLEANNYDSIYIIANTFVADENSVVPYYPGNNISCPAYPAPVNGTALMLFHGLHSPNNWNLTVYQNNISGFMIGINVPTYKCDDPTTPNWKRPCNANITYNIGSTGPDNAATQVSAYYPPMIPYNETNGKAMEKLCDSTCPGGGHCRWTPDPPSMYVPPATLINRTTLCTLQPDDCTRIVAKNGGTCQSKAATACAVPGALSIPMEWTVGGEIGTAVGTVIHAVGDCFQFFLELCRKSSYGNGPIWF